MSLVATSAARVSHRTSERSNRLIQRRMRADVTYLALHPHEIEERLDELDREWDVERVLQVQASALTLGGSVLAAAVDRRWLALPIGVSFFLLVHGLDGWCPPLPILRALGVRTQQEIDEERFALKALRGDFERAVPVGAEAQRSEDVLHAVSEH